MGSVGPITVKHNLRHMAAWGYYRSPLPAMIHRGKVAILMYHRVIGDSEPARRYCQSGLYVTASSFRKHIEFLREHHEIISFERLLFDPKGLSDRKSYCIITFDDGWRDNYRHAFPVLKRYGVPATIFLPVAYVGSRRWFWFEKLAYLAYHHFTGFKELVADLFQQEGSLNSRAEDPQTLLEIILARFKEMPDEDIPPLVERLWVRLGEGETERIILDWQEIRNMSEYGISFGSHTVNHSLLTNISGDQVEEELCHSKALLERAGINFLPVFSYPNGNYDQDIVERVKGNGYRAAVTTRFGVEPLPLQNIFELKRIGVHNDISNTAALFSFRISGIRLPN